ncbi:cbb3-type cytochrome oxidase assembly protein CcoS [Motilimonas sp. KMU-193]|uniref:cbb3-type cytochrome oxidase assembly protein CcoS n=1 Tax=Motilimonas sp. KMU-193 TaxID=3388668 RepID=UPI00396AFF91
MSIIFMLIPIAILFVAIAIGLFFWAVRSDQFEDLDREGVNILFDEDDSQARNQANSASEVHCDKPNTPK